MKILEENFSYRKRLLMYKGIISPNSLVDTKNSDELDITTQGYGAGNWYIIIGKWRRRE